jgi:hypothetical protein
MHDFKILLFSIFVSLLGCSDGGRSTSTQEANETVREGPIVLADSTVEGYVDKMVSTVWCGDYAGSENDILWTARDVYIYENCDELQETMELVEAKSADGITAVFIRYSVGTKIFRDVVWLRRVRNRYARTFDRPSEYGDTDWSEAAIELREEADTWEDESANWYE